MKLPKITVKNHYLVAFVASLVVAISLVVAGFILPPRGRIDPTVLTAAGILWLWPTLAAAQQAIKEGRRIKLSKGDLTLSVDENE